MRRIPCLCESCSNQLKQEWIHGVEASKQPRFQNSPNCKYSTILGDYNNWIIMPFQMGKDTTSDDLDDIHHTILTSVASNIAATITANSCVVVNIDDPKTDECYIFKLTSSPYIS